MATKILGLQFMRSFFQLKGNRGSNNSCTRCPSDRRMKATAPPPPPPPIKLIRSDGVVKIYDQPIQVSELMLEFPKHMVCSSDSFYIGQKIPALSEHDHLQPGNNYFLLPNHLFQSVLSFVTITSFLASPQCQSHDHLKKQLLNCQPFHIQKTPSGYLRLNVSEEFISKLMMEEHRTKHNHHHHRHDHSLDRKATHGRVCTTTQLQKDYVHLVAPRHWKPKLETIKETREKRRKLDSACAVKRSRKKSQSLQTHKIQKSRSLPEYSSLPSVSTKQSKMIGESTHKSRPLIYHRHHHHRSKIRAFLARNRGRKQVI